MWTIMNSPLNLYSALEITKYFQRHSLSLFFFFPAAWGSFLSIPFIVTAFGRSYSPLIPPTLPTPFPFPRGQDFLLGPSYPGWYWVSWVLLGTTIGSSYILCITHCTRNKSLQKDALKMLLMGPLAGQPTLAHVWPMKYPLQSEYLTHFLWWFAYLFIVCPLLKVLPMKSL